MKLREQGVNSADSVSWHACREAEQLSDRSMVDELAEYVAIEPNKKKRDRAYFIVGKLGLRCRTVDCARILVGSIHRETDKYVLSNILDRLSALEKPREVDLSPVFPLLKDTRWLVRHAAIQALKNSDSPKAEAEVIAVLNRSDDAYDMTYCHSTLSTIGSMEAIPYIEKNFSSPKRDVKHSAQYAVHAIMARHGVRP
jgi:hypothetical protein